MTLVHWWNAEIVTDVKDSSIPQDGDQIDDLAHSLIPVSGTVTSTDGFVSVRASFRAPSDRATAEKTITEFVDGSLKEAKIEGAVSKVSLEREADFEKKYGFTPLD